MGKTTLLGAVLGCLAVGPALAVVFNPQSSLERPPFEGRKALWAFPQDGNGSLAVCVY